MTTDGRAGPGHTDRATANRKHHVKVFVQVKVLAVTCTHVTRDDEIVGTIEVRDFRLDVFYFVDDWGAVAGANPPVK